MRPTLAKAKRVLLDSRNIHKIPPRNDSYLARAAIASATARLIAGERWSTIGAALRTVAALLALNFITLGGSVWHAFGDSAIFTQTVVLERGRHRRGENLSTKSCERDLICSSVLARYLRGCSAAEGFRLFLCSGPCDGSASASLFRRVAG
jgi:hypothetical protein